MPLGHRFIFSPANWNVHRTFPHSHCSYLAVAHRGNLIYVCWEVRFLSVQCPQTRWWFTKSFHSLRIAVLHHCPSAFWISVCGVITLTPASGLDTQCSFALRVESDPHASLNVRVASSVPTDAWILSWNDMEKTDRFVFRLKWTAWSFCFLSSLLKLKVL